MAWLPIFAYLLICLYPTSGAKFESSFEYRLQLDPTYALSWKVEGDSVVFQVEAKTLGWIGLGFGLEATMAGADLVIGGVRNGTGYLYDRHGTGNTFPPLDEEQNYDLVNGIENDTHTVLNIKRKLDTKDANDWKFDSRRVQILWAYNPNDAVSANDINMHSIFGSTDIGIPIPASTSSLSTSIASGPTAIPTTSAATAKAQSNAEVSANWSVIDFPHRATLDSDGAYQLFWKYDEETISFQYHAATRGWAGIGFSPNGGMAGADMGIFWIDQSGKGHVSDRYATRNGFPPEDAHQDYNLISSTKNDTHLIVIFSRKRNTCDSQDYALTDNTVRVIFASNDEVPQNKDSFKKHKVRGSRSLRLFEKKADLASAAAKDAMPLEFRVTKVHIPDNISTTYWCEVLVLPKLSRKMHIIKTEPIIEKQNIDIVHHIIVYVCSKNMREWVGKGRSCFKEGGETEIEVFSQCRQQALAGWAVGGESKVYPDNVGHPLYNDAGDMFVMMEMHYDNSQLKKGKIDSSGMRVWITEKLRPVDVGQMTLGIPVEADEQVIPPGVKEFTNYGYCSAQCVDWMPKQAINVIFGFLHTHLAGRKLRVNHFRKGKQLPPVVSDEHYDFNYQDTTRLAQPVTIIPGDELVLECVYETLDRNETTFSGPGTHDEMCLAFIEYYPAVYRGFVCMSTPNKRELYKTLGINFVPFNSSQPQNNDVLLSKGEHVALPDYLKKDFKFNWTPEKINQFQKASRDGKHSIICLRQDLNKPEINFSKITNGKIEGFDIYEQNGYPNVTEPLIIPDVCNKKQSQDKEKTANNIGDHDSQLVAQQLRERDDNNAGVCHKIFYSLSLMAISIVVVLFFTSYPF